MTQRMATLSQYAGMKRFGISGQEVQGNIDSGRWEELTGAGATLAGRLSGGDPYAWSEMAQQGMAPAWANRMGPGGMAQGTFGTQALQTAAQAGGWGGRVGGFLGGLQNAPGAIQSEAGGTIEISTGQVTVKTGGKIGVEDWSTAENRGYQRWQFGQQREALQAQETYTRASWGLQDQQTALGYQHQQANFGFQWEQLGMQDRQFYERRGIQGAQMQAQISWGQEDMARNFQRQMTQFDWAEEDLAYQGTQSTLHYAWGQEDIREQMRYATGRQRRQLMKQEQRATIDYAMGMGRLDTQGERLDERRGWAEEDFNREKDRYQQRSRWSMQLFELQGKHHEENMDLQRRRLTENERYFEDNHKLQEEARDLQREYLEENHERQEKALEMSEKHFEVMTMIQDVQREIDRNMQMQTAAWNQFWASGGEFESAWRGILDYINSGMPGSSTSVGGSHDSGLSWME